MIGMFLAAALAAIRVRMISKDEQLHKLSDLKALGVIDVSEFDQLKAKTIGCSFRHQAVLELYP